jgi:hypothetical protein
MRRERERDPVTSYAGGLGDCIRVGSQLLAPFLRRLVAWSEDGGSRVLKVLNEQVAGFERGAQIVDRLTLIILVSRDAIPCM